MAARVIRSKIFGSRGYSLLEFALTLPILFTLVLGAIDLNSGIQAYTAVQEGVRTAVRCSTTTDGDCIEVASAARTPFYNWVVYRGTSPDERFGYKYYYGGTERFLRAPVYRLSDFSAYRLASVDVPYTTNVRNAAELEFPAEGIAPTVFRAFLPRVRVNRQPNLTPRVEFRYQVDRSGNSAGGSNGRYRFENAQRYTNRIVVPNVRIGTRDKVNRTATFLLPNIDTFGCKSSRSFNQGPAADHGPDNKSCSDLPEYRNASLGNDTTVAIYIEARSEAAFNPLENTDTVTGNISLNIPSNKARNDFSPGSTSSFGGRRFDAGSDASLCPRGFPLSYIEGVPIGCTESTGYTQIKIPRGKPIKLNFTLNNQSGRGRIIWETTKIHVYYPEFTIATGEKEQCANGLLASEIPNTTECIANSGAVLVDVNLKDAANFPNNYSGIRTHIPNIAESLEAVSGPTTADCSLISTALNQPESSLNCQNYFELDSVREERAAHIDCPTNTGQGVDKNGNIYDPALTLQVCPPSADFIGITDTPIWKTEKVAFNDPDVMWQPVNCEDSSPPIPSNITRYPNHSYKTNTDHYSQPIYQGRETDPRVSLREERFSCTRWGGQFRAESAEWDENTRDEKFFSEVRFEHTLGCDEDTWHKAVRNKAVALGLNNQAYFEPWRHTGSDGESNGSILGPVSEAVWDQHNESCEMPFSNGQPNEQIGTIDGSCENTARPEACNADNTICLQQFAGFCGENSENTDLSQNIDLVAAEAYFYGRLQSTYPAAKFGCEGSNCATIREVPATSAPSREGHKTVAYEGEITTPLILTRIFGRDSWTFKYTDERVMESELSR